MDRLLSQSAHDFTTSTTTLPADLQKIVHAGFREEQDCILLKDSDYFGPGFLDSDFEKTEYEDFLNDIHIDNYITAPGDEFEYLKAGLEFAKKLYLKLKEDNRTSFRIIISFNETTYKENEIEIHGGCVVKFHMIRPSCDDKFEMADLDKFELDAMMLME